MKTREAQRRPDVDVIVQSFCRKYATEDERALDSRLIEYVHEDFSVVARRPTLSHKKFVRVFVISRWIVDADTFVIEL
jgi:hypothetical protein